MDSNYKYYDNMPQSSLIGKKNDILKKMCGINPANEEKLKPHERAVDAYMKERRK